MKLIYEETIEQKILKALREVPPWKKVAKVEVTPEEWCNLKSTQMWWNSSYERFNYFKINGVPVEVEGPTLNELRDRALSQLAHIKRETKFGAATGVIEYLADKVAVHVQELVDRART